MTKYIVEARIPQGNSLSLIAYYECENIEEVKKKVELLNMTAEDGVIYRLIGIAV